MEQNTYKQSYQYIFNGIVDTVKATAEIMEELCKIKNSIESLQLKTEDVIINSGENEACDEYKKPYFNSYNALTNFNESLSIIGIWMKTEYIRLIKIGQENENKVTLPCDILENFLKQCEEYNFSNWITETDFENK